MQKKCIILTFLIESQYIVYECKQSRQSDKTLAISEILQFSISFTLTATIEQTATLETMFRFFAGNKKPLKGYKITGVDRKQKYGIAADSLGMLKEKASAKLKVSVVCVHNHSVSLCKQFVT